MGRQATGTIQWMPPKAGETQGHYKCRITLADGTRPWIHLPPSAKSPQAERTARTRAEFYAERARREGITSVPKTTTGDRSPVAKEGDAQAWVDAWIKSRQKRGLTSATDNRGHYATHIKPLLPKHVREWTRDDLRALCHGLDLKVQNGDISWKTAVNIWATVLKMCSDACESKIDALRVREDNPAQGVPGPDRGENKSKAYLYPNEFLAFVQCDDVPLKWKRLVSVAIYLYARAGELRVLQWEDVDLAHATIHIHRAFDRTTKGTKGTKTSHPRRFTIEPALLPLLKAMHQESGGKGLVFADMQSERTMARSLRLYLKKAGVHRAELHHGSATRKHLVFHDLRATGITWMAIRGDDHLKIMQRVGHEDFQTTQGYIRTAEELRQGFGEVFPPLPESLGGEPDAPKNVIVNAGFRNDERDDIVSDIVPDTRNLLDSLRGGRDLNPQQTNDPLQNTPIPDDTIAQTDASCASKCLNRHDRDDSKTLPDAARLLAMAEAIDALLRAGLTSHARTLMSELIDVLRQAQEPTADVIPLNRSRFL